MALIKVKTCQFPDCIVEFEGIEAAKYCDEHRKPIYRKAIIDYIEKNKLKEKIESLDII